MLLKSFGIKQKTATVKKPNTNGIIEHVHGVINDIIRTQELNSRDFEPVNPWGDILVELSWAIRSLYHTMLNTTPGKLVFSIDALFDMQFTPDWKKIRQRK